MWKNVELKAEVSVVNARVCCSQNKSCNWEQNRSV